MLLPLAFNSEEPNVPSTLSEGITSANRVSPPATFKIEPRWGHARKLPAGKRNDPVASPLYRILVQAAFIAKLLPENDPSIGRLRPVTIPPSNGPVTVA